MGNYFGTDGIRAEVSKIDFSIFYRLGLTLSGKNKKFLVASDTRTSSSVIKSIFILGVIMAGGESIDSGVLPTPAVAYLSKNYDYGVMITASHNPSIYNGIKFFKKGQKIDDSDEILIEKSLFLTKQHYFGKLKYKNLKNHYIKAVLAEKESLSGKKIVLDLANGATTATAKTIFKRLGCNVICINSKKDGKKINKNCGAVYPQTLQSTVLKHEADMGFAFDGDGDRIVAVDEKGEVLDGDDLIFILAKNDNKTKRVVVTNLSNEGLIKELNELNIEVFRCDVGDKNVYKMMLEKSASLGGENSGHIIDKNFLGTGDGVYIAKKIACLAEKNNQKLSEMRLKNKYFQLSENLKIDSQKEALPQNVLNKIAEYASSFKNFGRVLVRKSGTEPVIRIMAESQNLDHCKDAIEKIKSIILEG